MGLLLSALAAPPLRGASSGTSGLAMMQGAQIPTNVGDYVASAAALDTYYSYFVEVPAGLNRLVVDLFDADVGAGAGEEAANRDGSRATAFDTTYRYTLIDPSGIQQAQLRSDVLNAELDNVWTSLYDSSNPIQLRGYETNTVDTAATMTINNPGQPNGTRINDLIVIILAKDNTGTINTPAGFTLIQQNGCNGGSCRLAAFYKVAVAADVTAASYTVTWTNTEQAVGAVLVFSNVDTTTPIDISALSNPVATSTTPTAPTVTTTVANTRVVRTYVQDNNGPVVSGTYPANHVGLYTIAVNSSPDAGTAMRTQAAAGATGTAAFTTPDNSLYVAITFAIRPAAANPARTAGHWELRADGSSAVNPTAGVADDINALGVRAHDGTSGAGGTELNVYYDSYSAYGTNIAVAGPPVGRAYTDYPYITSGCAASDNNFDWDFGNGGAGALTGVSSYTSRTAAFTQAATMSGNDAWARTTLTGWTTDTFSGDYGIWAHTARINQYGDPPATINYGQIYVGNFNAVANPPTTQPQANTFRIYLPSDAGTAPAKPYIDQVLTYGGNGSGNGPNPPVQGQQTIFTVTVRVVNPTPFAITFSAANLVRATVPGAPVLYGGGAQASQGAGSITAPALGGSGAITWNPGSVAAGSVATPTIALMSYRVRVTPTATPQRIPVTATPASGNGTRATFVDETGNATQARALYTMGGICELAANTAVVTPAVVANVHTTTTSGGVLVEWDTASEVGVAGFDVLRWDGKTYSRVNARLVPALLESAAGGHYRVLDSGAWGGRAQTYAIQAIETTGTSRSFGPFHLTARAPAGPVVTGSAGYSREAAKTARFLGSRAEQKRAAAQRAAPAAVAAGNFPVAAKIGVREPGLYFVSSSAIGTALGLPGRRLTALLDTAGFAITNRGLPIAWTKSPWDDGLLFYGEATEGVYSRDNVYWLRIGAGLTMTQRDAGGPDPAPGGVFGESLHAEEDRLAATIVSTNPKSDYWYWDYLVAGDALQGRKAFTLQAPGLGAAGAASLHVDVHGATTSGVANEHHVVVRLNGAEVGQGRFAGIAPFSLDLPVNPALLLDGANSVEVEDLLDTGAPYSIVYVDGFTLAYPRRYEAANDALAFRGDASAIVTVSGFADDRLLALDLTHPDRPRLLNKMTLDADGADHRASLRPLAPATPYLAVSRSAWKTPSFVRGRPRTKLAARHKGADWIALTTAELMAPASELAARREAQGLRTAVVDVEDVYDEFGDGSQSPEALKAFLKTAYERWSPRPRFVLLAGKGSFDYRENLGLGGNLVPPLMVSTPWGLFASDSRLADVAGDDGLPELAIGRLPVSSAAEFSAYNFKVAAYEADAPATPRALLVADEPDGDVDFGIDSESLADALPPGYDADRVYLLPGGIAAARTSLLGSFSLGAELMSYVGHGGLDRLSSAGLLVTPDVGVLRNGGRAPILVALTCIINRYEVPGFVSLGEALVTQGDGGAVAVWAPTGLSENVDAGRYGRFAYQALSGHPGARIGEDFVTAARGYSATDGLAALIDVYTLLGDPALRIKTAPPASGGGPGVGAPSSGPGG